MAEAKNNPERNKIAATWILGFILTILFLLLVCLLYGVYFTDAFSPRNRIELHPIAIAYTSLLTFSFDQSWLNYTFAILVVGASFLAGGKLKNYTYYGFVALAVVDAFWIFLAMLGLKSNYNKFFYNMIGEELNCTQRISVPNKNGEITECSEIYSDAINMMFGGTLTLVLSLIAILTGARIASQILSGKST